jgi:hypothetical protein
MSSGLTASEEFFHGMPPGFEGDAERADARGRDWNSKINAIRDGTIRPRKIDTFAPDLQRLSGI